MPRFEANHSSLYVFSLLLFQCGSFCLLGKRSTRHHSSARRDAGLEEQVLVSMESIVDGDHHVEPHIQVPHMLSQPVSVTLRDAEFQTKLLGKRFACHQRLLGPLRHIILFPQRPRGCDVYGEHNTPVTCIGVFYDFSIVAIRLDIVTQADHGPQICFKSLGERVGIPMASAHQIDQVVQELCTEIGGGVGIVCVEARSFVDSALDVVRKGFHWKVVFLRRKCPDSECVVKLVPVHVAHGVHARLMVEIWILHLPLKFLCHAFIHLGVRCKLGAIDLAYLLAGNCVVQPRLEAILVGTVDLG